MTELAFSQAYKLGNRFAQGSRGMLYECTHNATGRAFACKIVRGEDNIRVNRSEEKMTRACDHNNIVRIHKVSFDYTNHFTPRKMIVYDRAEGDMFNYVVEDVVNEFTESQAKTIIRQMLNAVVYLHSNNIVHRDIKLENFLYDRIDKTKPKTPDNINVVLTDFEFADFAEENGYLRGRKGTDGYIAPEIFLDDYYTSAVDVWAMGVCCHSILTKKSILKYPPSSKYTFGRYERFRINYNTLQWKSRSEKAKEFVDAFLQQDPTKRWSIQDALNHEWLTC
tara:strand:- start:3884 stop:4723 length:840 start_codon:yes stop_codon:yes gene_type:complete